MRRDQLLVLLSAVIIQGVISLQLEKLLVPSHSIRHTDVTLECHYKLEEETLYSVKWYKDGHEFYRYVPRNQPPAQVFNLQGVTVDLHNSTDCSVVLSAVQLSTSGRYRCEVSGEAPYFETVTDHANMMVVAPPKGGPEITGGQPRYHVGDLVNVTCSSKESKPAAQLSWMINGEPELDFFLPRWVKSSADAWRSDSAGLIAGSFNVIDFPDPHVEWAKFDTPFKLFLPSLIDITSQVAHFTPLTSQ